MKKSMKSVGIVLLSLSLILSVLTGCGTKPAASSGETKDVIYRSVDEIKADGTINIGVFSDKAPSVLR